MHWTLGFFLIFEDRDTDNLIKNETSESCKSHKEIS